MTWKYLYTSVKGTSHQLNGSPCQDASFARLWQGPNGEEALISIAADGAGSASYSKFGSHLACRFLFNVVSQWLLEHSIEQATREVALSWFQQTQLFLNQVAERKKIKPRELSTTLLLSVTGLSHALFVQLGDGAIVYWDSAEYQLAFWPQNGEYQNTTYFVTDENALEKLDFLLLDQPVHDVALLTDGLQMLAIEQVNQRPFLQFFKPVFAQLHQDSQIGHLKHLQVPLKNFLSSDKVNARTDDDKTLILGTTR